MLEGLKVVEFATYIAAPGAAGIMTDWGATVIKVESHSGDPQRRFLMGSIPEDEIDPAFTVDNRGKRSIVLDIGKPEGREAMVRLAKWADVFLTNVRPAALKRARLDYETLSVENPGLVYCSVTGYGLTGPDMDRAGFDVAAFWARAGVASITAPKGVEPFPIRTGMGDHVTSLATVSAILAAVYEKKNTGKGRLVETSLLRAGAYSISSDLSVQLRMGRLASTRPRPLVVEPLMNFFKTSDGRWFALLAKDGGRDYANIVRAAGLNDLVEDERFVKTRNRRQNGAALVEALDAAFAAMTLEEAAARLDAEDVVWAPVQTPAELTRDAQAEAAGVFVDVPGAASRSLGGPARFPGADDGPKGPAPKQGEHTREVLAELGYAAGEVDALFESRAAG